jgi:hypothetical protein
MAAPHPAAALIFAVFPVPERRAQPFITTQSIRILVTGLQRVLAPPPEARRVPAVTSALPDLLRFIPVTNRTLPGSSGDRVLTVRQLHIAQRQRLQQRLLLLAAFRRNIIRIRRIWLNRHIVTSH